MARMKPPLSDNRPEAPVWYVLGAGAMGCLWAAYLYQAGHRVCFLLRDQQALQRYQRAGGLRLRQFPDGDLYGPLPIAAALSEAPGEPVKRLLLATKAGQAQAALEALTPRLAPDAQLLLLQNGLQLQQQLTQQLGGRVFCLSTSHGAFLQADFDVVHAGLGQAWLGSLHQPPPTALLQALCAELPWQPLRVTVESQMAARLWHKLAINCAVNALTVVYNCRNGELLHIAEARRRLRALCGEIEQLLRALPEAPDVAPLWPRVRQVLQQTASNVSSTLQDARQGRAAELAHLNGYLCQRAQAAGVNCVLNQQVMQQALHRIDSGMAP